MGNSDERARELHAAMHIPGHPDEANCVEVIATALDDAWKAGRDAAAREASAHHRSTLCQGCPVTDRLDALLAKET